LALPEEYSSKRILIVDDQTFNINALKIILENVFKLDTKSLCSIAKNGQEAVDQVIKSTEHFAGRKCGYALIFMDCNMPVLDGYEATTRIRSYIHKKQVKQPIISAVTGHTEKMYVKKAIDSGMN